MNKSGYPARLLDLGSSATDSKLRLVDVNDIEAHPTYLALSHCWGGTLPVVLKLDTIELFKDSIDMEELPTSFKHAIQMTQHLSVRDPTVLETLMVSIPPPSQYRGIYALFDAHSWETNMTLAPLNQRAWVVQERLLSPCVLHFGRDQIAWECQELQACETFPNGLPEIVGAFGDSKCKTLLLASDDGEEDFPLIRWERIAQIYSQCQLTQEGDICIALAGVAEEFRSRMTNDRYVAGLWASDLVAQMCWATNELENAPRHVIPTRPAHYRAPSWSWMSIKSSINFYAFANKSSMFEILDCKIETMSENKLGTIRGGYVLGCGILTPAKWRCSDDDSKVKQLVVDGHAIESGGYWDFGLPQVIMDLGTEEPCCDAFCLPLVRDATSDRLQLGFYVGLVLAHVDRRRDGDIYRRVGCFHVELSFGNRCFLHQGSRNEDGPNPAERKIMIV
ncbi:MAG: hypothetical protein Q9195_004097 [Heterodermia aff. obscurata]